LKVTMMDAALKYAEANIRLCLCTGFVRVAYAPARQGVIATAGKASLYTGWYKNSTTDVKQINKWWRKAPMPYRHYYRRKVRLAGA